MTLIGKFVSFVGAFVRPLKSKARFAAVAIAVLTALEAQGVLHLDPDVYKILGAVGLLGVRNAIDRLGA